uniref:HPS6 biogenesis of lysosomal organelles complex 2 subunit 3 n=1 Tax=Astatotilapia calliptera TaxID=8154 RepID=A0A3P8P402_ASTCA
MAGLVLKQLSDFGDFSHGKELTEILSLNNNEQINSVRMSPDGRHIHVVLRKPKVSLVTFDKYERPQLAPNQKKLDLCVNVPIVDIFYLEHHGGGSSSSGAAVVAVVYESGKVEFWKFQECKSGWHLLQTSQLCNSPRAKVVSVCACSNLIIWCEERPPSESSPVLSATRNKLRNCVCRRDFEVNETAVSLGGVKIALHNNPDFTVVSSGEYVHLLPDLKSKPLLNISKFFLSWSPRYDSFTVSTTCKNTPLKKLSAKESDFMKLVIDCLGYLSPLEPPEICSFSPTACGGLLLLLSTGWLCLLQKDGVLRQVYKLEDNCLVNYSTHTSLGMYEDTLALIMGQNLHLIDLNCGRELEKIVLMSEALLYTNRADMCTPHLLSETGLFVVVSRGTDSRDCSFRIKSPGFSTVESIHPGALLVEAVFEEACKYYQQRSLSSTPLTVDSLKKGGRFQAPISLASILFSYLSAGFKQKGAQLSQNGGGGCITGQDKLMGSLEAELKALVSLEEVKGTLVRGSVKEVEAMCESLVEKEVLRLLSSPELDKEALLYLNSIFSIFPSEGWKAAQSALQLHYNGEGFLSSRAPPDVWKTVLSAGLSSSPVASLSLTNGGPKHNRSLKVDYFTNCKGKSTTSTSSAALPVFELLCSLNPDRDQQQDLEVELLLVSGRPNAILQALRILMSKKQWYRVTQVAQKCCKQSPLLNKEIFTILLCEVAHHRDLDPYLDLLWTLCPEDFTVTTILNMVLKNLPSPNTPSHSSSFLASSSTSSTPPFTDPHSTQVTVGLLKPLLRKVLQRETKPSQRYVDILQSPSFPPPALPRQPTEQSGSVTDPSADSDLCNNITPALLAETPEQQTCTQTAIQRQRVALPANTV